MITKTFEGKTIRMSVSEAVAVKYGRAYIDWGPPYPCVVFYRSRLPGTKPEAMPPVQYKDVQDVFELEGE